MKRKSVGVIAGFVVIGLIATLSIPLLVLVTLGGWKKIKVDQHSGCTTSVVSSSTSSNSLLQAIFRNAAGDVRLALVLLDGTNLESDGDIKAVANGAYGAYQIQNPGHYPNPDITIAQALDPYYATSYMLPKYKAALAKVSSDMWRRNPALAAEEVVRLAEKPTVPYYQSQGWPKVNAAYSDAVSALRQQGVSGQSGIETVAATTTSGCGQDQNQITIDAAIQACLSKLGSSYTWKKPADGASLVSWCYQQAGVSIPGSITKLAAFKGSDATGVQATWLPPGSDFQAGDVMLWSNQTHGTDRTSAANAGMFDGLPLHDFTVATYNLLSATTHTPTSKRVGGCEAHPVPGDPTCGKTRAKREAAIISGAAGNPAFDIVGTQETSGIQYAELVKDLSGYHVYPDDSSRMNSSQDGAVAIFYNASKFSRFDQGTAPAISNTSEAVTNPWVGLRTSTGHRLYVMSIHYANGAHGGTPASIIRSSRLTMQWVRSKVGPDTTVIVMGDFNDQPSQKLSYCVYTAGGLMENASDMTSGGAKGCAKPPPFNGIDQIYATRGGGLSASGFKHLADSPTLRAASDHTPSFVTFHFPGKAKNSPFGNYIGPRAPTGKIGLLPVKPGKLLGALRFNIVAASGDSGGVWQSPLHEPCLVTDGYGWGDSSVRGHSFHDGVDCGVPQGTPVYAAHSGVVFRAEYNVYGGNQLVVDDSGTVGSGFGFKYEHLSTFVAGVIPGVPIKAGQLVGYSGETGQNVTGPHLHFSICSDVTACLAGSGAQGHATVDPIPFMRAHGVAFVSNG